MNRLSWLCVAVAIIGCSSSSGSGVTASKKLIELSASEQDKLCTYTVDIEGGPHTVTCSDGPITVDDKATCIANFSGLGAQCTATVDDAEGCAEAMGKDPCNFDFNACTALISCLIVFDAGS
jgi:hypothetical protein